MRCERCHRRCFDVRMSWLNTQMICRSCQANERKHPRYDEAKRREYEELKKGNYNFPGILEEE